MAEATPESGFKPIEKYFRLQRIAMPIEAFHCLPPNGAYKYEYYDGNAVISPQPHCHDVYLELDDFRARDREPFRRSAVRPLVDSDWHDLSRIAAAAFYRVAPCAGFDDEELQHVMADQIGLARQGYWGKLIPGASMIVETDWGADDTMMPVGAALVAMREGETNGGEPVPWLVWIFVSPMLKRHGAASSLLANVVRVLKEAGHSRLESVVCTGNHASMSWHWYMGFKIGPTIREKVEKRFSRK